jgi:hypothetical protein
LPFRPDTAVESKTSLLAQFEAPYIASVLRTHAATGESECAVVLEATASDAPTWDEGQLQLELICRSLLILKTE